MSKRSRVCTSASRRDPVARLLRNLDTESSRARRAGALGAGFVFELGGATLAELDAAVEELGVLLRRKYWIDRVYLARCRSDDEDLILVAFRLLRSDAHDLCHEVAEEVTRAVKGDVEAKRPRTVYEAADHACVQPSEVLNWLVPLAATHKLVFEADVIHDPRGVTYIVVSWTPDASA